jgi:Leucine-rich repeat (LRR) protein
MLNSKAAQYLTEVEFKFLDKLNISKNNLGPLGAKILSEKGKFPNLRELDISDNYLSKEGARGLSKGDAFTHIISLHIEDNEINDYGLYLLAIGKLNGVSELFLGRNKLGDDGLAYIENFKNLEILDLEGNLLTYKGVSNLIGKNFEKIKSINLDNNYIGVEGTFIIASQRRKIRKNDKEEFSHIDLKSLSLVRNNICTKGAELISIMYLELIEELNISENFISDLGFYFLCKGQLKNLKKLDASLNRISDKGLVYITEANFIEGLISLNLAGNDFTDDGVKYITFCKMSNLGHLDLTLNYLKSKTGSHLSKSFFNLLSSLSLERNK